MKRHDASYKLLMAAWLLFCGSVVAGLLFAIGWIANDPVDPLLALVVGAAAMAFVWMLSSGWREADLFKKALGTYVRKHGGTDA